MTARSGYTAVALLAGCVAMWLAATGDVAGAQGCLIAALTALIAVLHLRALDLERGGDRK